MRKPLQDMRIRNLQNTYPTARVVEYSNGERQVIVPGKLPHLGNVVTYSDGKSETTVNIY